MRGPSRAAVFTTVGREADRVRQRGKCAYATCSACGRTVGVTRDNLLHRHMIDSDSPGSFSVCRYGEPSMTPDDVTALTALLDLMADFPSNEQRARFLLSCNWMRDRDTAHAGDAS